MFNKCFPNIVPFMR